MKVIGWRLFWKARKTGEKGFKQRTFPGRGGGSVVTSLFEPEKEGKGRVGKGENGIPLITEQRH